MKEWSVELAIANPLGRGEAAEDVIDELVDHLARYSTVASYSAQELTARFTLQAGSVEAAVTKGLGLFVTALGKTGFGADPVFVRAEAETMADLDRRLMESNAPDIIGVAEVAGLLGVSKQRASELARSPEFPRPIVVLAAGPVWRKTSIARHIATWIRHPGRPRKTANA